MKCSVALLGAFLGGAIIGGALGVLFAPESGDETRRKIMEALEKRGIKLSKADMDDLVDEIKSEVTGEEKWFFKSNLLWRIPPNRLIISNNSTMM